MKRFPFLFQPTDSQRPLSSTRIGEGGGGVGLGVAREEERGGGGGAGVGPKPVIFHFTATL